MRGESGWIRGGGQARAGLRSGSGTRACVGRCPRPKGAARREVYVVEGGRRVGRCPWSKGAARRWVSVAEGGGRARVGGDARSRNGVANVASGRGRRRGWASMAGRRWRGGVSGGTGCRWRDGMSVGRGGWQSGFMARVLAEAGTLPGTLVAGACGWERVRKREGVDGGGCRTLVGGERLRGSGCAKSRSAPGAKTMPRARGVSGWPGRGGADTRGARRGPEAERVPRTSAVGDRGRDRCCCA